MSLAGHVAIVTGGAQGLGRDICARLADEGATVESLDLRDGVDVAEERAVKEAVAAVLEREGRIDILVNNAGIYPHIPFEDMTYADWRRVLSTNLDGVFLCTRAVYPAMRGRRYGRILNISSATFFIGYPGLSAYVASKGGIIGFTRSLASEAGRHGVTVNAIAPGLLATERALSEEAEVFAEVVPQQAIPRPGRTQDIADCAAYLVRPESSWITGQTINVDGGHRYH
ncbi:MAG: SDR family NAD(P)-dependent oxidoreductase [Solirubrobacteraceae bacterium]